MYDYRKYDRSFILLLPESGGFAAEGQKLSGTAILEIRNGKGKATVNIQGLKTSAVSVYKLYLISSKDGGAVGVCCGTLIPEARGKAGKIWDFDPENVGGSSLTYDDINVVAVIVKNGNTPLNEIIAPLAGYKNGAVIWKSGFREFIANAQAVELAGSGICEEEAERAEEPSADEQRSAVQSSVSGGGAPAPESEDTAEIPKENLQRTENLSAEQSPFSETPPPIQESSRHDQSAAAKTPEASEGLNAADAMDEKPMLKYFGLVGVSPSEGADKKAVPNPDDDQKKHGWVSRSAGIDCEMKEPSPGEDHNAAFREKLRVFSENFESISAALSEKADDKENIAEKAVQTEAPVLSEDDRHDSRHDGRHDGRHDDRHDDRLNGRHDDKHDGKHDGRHDGKHDGRHDEKRGPDHHGAGGFKEEELYRLFDKRKRFEPFHFTSEGPNAPVLRGVPNVIRPGFPPVVPPAIPIFDIKWIQITQNDIYLLPEKLWLYAVNPFVANAAARYGHLLLGVSGRQKRTYYFGVPGTYSERERVRASTLGFTTFMPVNGGIPRQGEFGYWILEAW